MKKRSREIVLWMLTITVLALTGVISTLYNAEIDLSADKIYSLSTVSKDILRDSSKSITITYYVSPELNSFSQLPERISDYIEEYDAFGGPQVDGRTVHVETEGVRKLEARKLIEDFGLVPQPFESTQRSGQERLSFFSGIVIESTDRMTSIPFIYDMETLEYEITSGIKRIMAEEIKQLGIIIGDNNRTIERHYSLLARLLVSLYTVRSVPHGTSIPEEIDALLILGQQDITAKDTEFIEVYIREGGSVLFCLDPVYVDLDNNLIAEPASNIYLNEMLSRYGVEIAQKLILDSSMKQLRIPLLDEESGETVWRNLGPYPFWISMQPENINTAHPVTVRFQGLDLLWCSPLNLKKVPDFSHTILAQTTADAWLMERPYMTQPHQQPSYTSDRETSYGTFPTAVSVRGKLADNQDSASKLIVIGDTDFASNLLEYSDSLHNLLFFEGAVNWLTQEDELLTLLKKNKRTGGFESDFENGFGQNRTPSSRLEYKRRSRLLVMLNVFIIPLAVILFGVIRYNRRKKQ